MECGAWRFLVGMLYIYHKIDYVCVWFMHMIDAHTFKTYSFFRRQTHEFAYTKTYKPVVGR
jgi:hypothetical protein